MAGIASSLISAFLQHQFAKERLEQQAAQADKQHKEDQQARLQQALMMKDITAQQQEFMLRQRQTAQEAALKMQIADRQMRHKESQDLRKQMADQAIQVRKQLATEGIEARRSFMEERQAEREQAREEGKVEWGRRMEIMDKLIRERAETGRVEGAKIGAEEKLDQPALPGTYLDEQDRVVPTPASRREVKENQYRYLRQGSLQETTHGAGLMSYNHLSLTANRITNLLEKKVIGKDRSRVRQYLTTELGRLLGDPDVASLVQFLGPATSLAVARQYSAPGMGGVRGGVRLAEMFAEGLYARGDNLNAVLAKTRDLATLTKMSLEDQSLPTAKIDKLLTTLDKLEAFGGIKKR